MENIKNGMLILGILCFSIVISFAQKGQFSTFLNVGVTNPFLEDGSGFQAAINPYYMVSKGIAIEGQISYARTNIESAFISGQSGVDKSLNILFGPKFYLAGPDKKVRPYLNLLLGILNNKEEREGMEREPSTELGLSTGAYLQISDFVLGISFDTPSNGIFKVGYNLQLN